MKTSEQAMRAFVRCFSPLVEIRCDLCPYRGMKDCQKAMAQDVYKHIQNLESTYSQVGKALCGKENATLGEVLQAASQVKNRLAQVERERDALYYDLARLPNACDVCTHGQNNRDDCEELFGTTKCAFEWRGICEENTEDDADA